MDCKTSFNLKNRLKGVVPIDTRTPQKENISSFMGRTASYYGLTTGKIIDWYIAPMIDKRYLVNIARNGGTRFYENSSMVLSHGKAASYFVDALTELTGVVNLEQHTMLPFAGMFAARGLIYPRRRWCPLCYGRWLYQREPLRDLLLWALQVVTICNDHGIPLHSLCHRCGRSSFHLERTFLPGYCSHCNSWLGLRKALHNQFPLPSEEEVWKVNQAEWLLSHHKDINETSVHFFLINCIKNYPSMKAFSRNANIPIATLSGWIADRRLPPLSSFIDLSWHTRDPLSRMNEKNGINDLQLPERKIVVTTQRTSGLFLQDDPVAMEWEQKMWAVVQNRYPPPSLAQVARELHASERLLRLYTPDFCRMIAASYQNYLIKRKEVRHVAISKKLHLTFRKLAFTGNYPSRRLLEQAIAPALLRENSLKPVWNKCFGQISLW